MNQKVVILGGGTCGYITALFLRKNLSIKDITVIASSKKGTIGVGESTIPFVVDFLQSLGISDKELIESCNATYKMGIAFSGWGEKDYNHSFLFWKVPSAYGDIPFAYFWYKYFRNIDFDCLVDPAFEVFGYGKSPFDKDRNTLYEYAFHLDAGLLGAFLEKKLLQLGIKIVDDTIQTVKYGGDGEIKSLIGESKIFLGDIFFDCSGFTSVLKTQKNSFEKFDELLCDSAIVGRTETLEDYPPYTLSEALSTGWRWQIPLREGTGNGYVYSSKYISDEDALSELRSTLGKDKSYKFRKLTMRIGKFKKSWVGNCVVLGSAYGFVEPLEATGIFIFCKQLELFKKYFLGGKNEDYNNEVSQVMQNLREFIGFHYYTANTKYNTLFWEKVKDKNIYPSSFQRRINIFHKGFPHQKHFGGNDLFTQDSFTKILIGNDFLPKFLEEKKGADLFIQQLKRDIKEGGKRSKKTLKKLLYTKELL